MVAVSITNSYPLFEFVLNFTFRRLNFIFDGVPPSPIQSSVSPFSSLFRIHMSILGSPIAMVQESVPSNGKTFAQTVVNSSDLHLNQLPQRSIRGDSVSIRISQAEYDLGIEDCKRSLHGRLTL